MPSIEHFYREYHCSSNSPLSCDRPWQTAQEVKGAKFCLECGFPATLPHKAEIKGNRGIYHVMSFLGVRGMGRLYSGTQQNDNEPVIIKEYLLPNRCFNEEETRQRQETFKRVAGVTLADGRIQNFRLLNPWEAIADQAGERCYLVTKGMEPFQTLSHHLREKGAMDASDVREVLDQALQTLEFLHTQKLRLPSNQVQMGLAHGNLSLDSILIEQENNKQFYIYLCDLALWEYLFVPPSIAQASNPKSEQDLISLGQVAFYLWAGRTKDYTTGQPLDPRDIQQWPNSDRHLKQFLYDLMGLDTPFDSAAKAREALLELPKEGQASSSAPPIVIEKEENSWRRTLFILLGVLALLLFGGGIWYLVFRPQLQSRKEYPAWEGLPAKFSDIGSVPLGQFTYTGETEGTWRFILNKPLSLEGSLKNILTQPKPDVKATFNFQPVQSLDSQKDRTPITTSTPVEKVRSDENTSFAITSLEDKVTGDDIDKKKIAYDGLLVFVANSKKDSNLPKALKGQISLEDLRKIYTGEIKNWQQLGGPDLPIKAYAPTEPEALHIFQKRVLKDNPTQVDLFYRTVSPDTFIKSTRETLDLAYQEFDTKQTGIISFGIISKILDQCRGYPLALVDDNKPAIQALSQSNGQPINPDVYLSCNKGKLYYPDVQTFITNSYPLGYPLFVVYPRDDRRLLPGSKFAEMLGTTRQGQCLLSKAGLVPLQPVPKEFLSDACK